MSLRRNPNLCKELEKTEELERVFEELERICEEQLGYAIMQKQLERIYNEQLRYAIINQHIFRQAREVWRTSKRDELDELMLWMVQTYIAFVATAIRRFSEKPPRPQPNQDPLSMVIFLSKLEKETGIRSRRRYELMYSKDSRARKLAGRDFDQIAGRKNARLVSLRRIRADKGAILKVAKKTKAFVDKVIAHTDLDRRTLRSQTWEDIDEAIEVFAKTYSRYYLLLHARAFDPRCVVNGIDVTEDLRRIWPSST